MKVSIQREVTNQIIYNEYYSKRIDKKYVTNRQTSLEEMKRLYIYFNGNTKGMAKWISFLKEMFPECKTTRDNSKLDRWDFHQEDIWEIVNSIPSWKLKLDKQIINSFDELSIKISPY